MSGYLWTNSEILPVLVMTLLSRLSKRDLLQIAQTLAVANTPLSLLTGLRRSSAFDKLRRAAEHELSEAYNELTSRPKQTEIVVALSYTVLISLFSRAVSAEDTPVDQSRLRWGEQMRRYLLQSTTATRSSILSPEIPLGIEQARSEGRPMLYGPNDRPLDNWRNAID